MKSVAILWICCLCIAACHSTTQPNSTDKKPEQYLRWVGDIEADPELDSPDFSLCNTESKVKQYFNDSRGLEYKGEFIAIEKAFRQKYQPVPSQKSGLIRIRFIVNCQGESGRFRLSAMDWNYQPQEFDEVITSQLLQITKGLNGWMPKTVNGELSDYYQYLTFTIEEGNLTEIMP